MKSIFSAPDVSMSGVVLDTATRIDAICYCGNGMWLCGGRRQSADTVGGAGKVWRYQAGAWSHVSTLPGQPNINALEFHEGRLYALAGNGYLWESETLGDTWLEPTLVSTSTTSSSILTYGLCLTPAGTVLISDTRTGGGKIFRRSADASAFVGKGAFTNNRLYRFLNVEDGILVGGWAGQILKSTDDGQTWSVRQTLASVPLYAMGYLGEGKVLVGDEAGTLHLSENNGDTFGPVGTYDGAADDIASLGGGRLVYCTYTAKKRVYFSDNYGRSLRAVGRAPLSDFDDSNVDRFALGYEDGRAVVMGGCTRGAIVCIKTPH